MTVDDLLNQSLERALSRARAPQLAGEVRRLITQYRSEEPTLADTLGSDAAVAAYAAYRMPATYAVAAKVLSELARKAPTFKPIDVVDLGGGTGACLWAVVSQFHSVKNARVIDHASKALKFGEQLFSPAFARVSSKWTVGDLTAGGERADLLTASYVLGEMTSAARSRALENMLTGSPRVCVIIEPGTPRGFRTVLQARDALLATGYKVIAPCPHNERCGLLDRQDWCHFSTRVERSAIHRAAKEVSLSYEDEKFSYVVATRDESFVPTAGRVVRHPTTRKNRMDLVVCGSDTTVETMIVPKSSGIRYKDARHARWGDEWPTTPLMGRDLPGGDF